MTNGTMAPRSMPGILLRRDERGESGVTEAAQRGHELARHEHDEHDEHGPEHHEHVAQVTTWQRVDRELAALVVTGLALSAAILIEWQGGAGWVATTLYGLAILAGAVTIVPAGVRGVFRERSLDINFLVTVAVLGAMALGQWSEGATVVFLFSLGEWLEGVTLARTRRSIQALMAMAPETAQVRAPDGTEITLRVEDVRVGAQVLVRPGDRIPLDGVVTAGESAVDQAPITGESVPVDKTVGEPVYAGTVNGRGYLELRTTKPFAQNTLARIIHLVEEAQSEKAPSQRFVERFARIYTPLVVLAAILLTIVPPLLLNE